MIQPIYLYGSETLRNIAEPVDISQKESVTKLIVDLKDTLAKSDGCGLAAPQIGVSRRVCIVDGDVMVDVYPYLKGFKRTLINPVVLEESEEKCEYNEGCLSVPGIYCDVVRAKSIKLEYYDENFNKVIEDFDQFACRMIQHEMSHLDGILFVDMVAPIRKKMISKKLAKIAHGKIGTHYNSKIK